MPREQDYLRDIARACRQIGKFIAGLDEGAFATDEKTEAAVLYQILVIGEATRRLPEAYRAQHPSIPWKNVIGMRNRLIHEYDHVDDTLVWQVATRDVPPLLAYVERELDNLEG